METWCGRSRREQHDDVRRANRNVGHVDANSRNLTWAPDPEGGGYARRWTEQELSRQPRFVRLVRAEECCSRDWLDRWQHPQGISADDRLPQSDDVLVEAE